MTGPRDWLREAGAGLVAASLALPLCVGAGVLAFAPLGPAAVPEAARAGLLCAIAGGAAAALVRRSSFVISYPTTPTGVVQGSIVAGLVAVPGLAPGALMLAVVLCVALAGLWQILAGRTGLARAIRFVPRPVMAGFVTGVAALIAVAQLPVLRGAGPALFALALVLLMVGLGRARPAVPTLLAGLGVGAVLWHGLHALAPGLDLGTVVGAVPASSARALPAPDPGALAGLLANAAALKGVLLGSLTLATVGTLDTFFALRTAQFVADIPVDPGRDVVGQGVGNLAAAMAGGLACSTSLSVSVANHRAGGRGRLSALAAAAALLVAGVILPAAAALLPRVVLAAILCLLALRLADRWCLEVLHQALVHPEPARRRRARRDAAVLLAVFAATVLGRPVAGVAVGVALACLLFMLDLSRPEAAALHLLAGPTGPVAVLELHDLLFFGNAQALADALRRAEAAAATVLLDGRRVRELDSSAALVLAQAAARMQAAGIGLLRCGPAEPFGAALHGPAVPALHPDPAGALGTLGAPSVPAADPVPSGRVRRARRAVLAMEAG